ncbi:unnamed protein product [Linum trigynum]|uniref:Uncharacterized protein n=1 Tax=Linum trigynum TaxID=586398 RepID=A0AAV2DE97_9ROSI
MIEKTKKKGSHKRARISEEDISVVLERYTATTVLALLQEVGQLEGVKIDWNAIVKKTSSGISSVRECQMLWRHLAYRHCLSDNLDDGAQLQDNDSDLEYELEAYPEVSGEASAEAAACVKVLMASGLPTDANQANAGTVEAPLTINIPSSHSFRATSENSQPAARGMNITIPVSVQKQPMPLLAASEGMDINGSQIGYSQSKRKRKPWSEAEDLELIAAVRKYGEGNWANIVKSEFMGGRTPSQLSQRWGVIRKKNTTNVKQLTNSSDSIRSEKHLATRHAVNMALDRPPRLSFMNNNTGGGTTFASTRAVPSVTSNESPVAVKQEPPLKCPAVTKITNNNTGGGTTFASTKAVPPLSSNESSVAAKQEPPQKRPAVKKFQLMDPAANKGAAAAATRQNLASDPVRAAAVAAGARIASQSDAASLLKAAQANNAVHIMAKPGPPGRPTVLTGSSTHSETRPKVNQLPLPTSSIGLRQSASPSIVQRPPTSMKILSVKSRSELPQVRDGKTVEGCIKVCSSSPEGAGKAKVQQEGGGHGEQVKNDDRTASGNKDPKQNGKMPVARNPGPLIPNKVNVENGKVGPLEKKPQESRNEDESKNNGACSSKESEKKQPATQGREENDENRSMNKQQQQDVPKIGSGNGCSEKMEKVGRAGEDAGNKVQADKDGVKAEKSS